MTTQVITPDEIRHLLESGRPLNLIDVRTPPEFAQVHASGARLMPLDELDPAAIAASRQESHEPIYVLCQSGGRATKACEYLERSGVGPAFCVEGGTTAWERAGLPVERGPSRIISLERQVRIGAGALVLLGLACAWLIHPVFYVIPAFVAAGLVFSGITDYCGMGMLLAKMPWNQAAKKCSR